MNIKIMKNKIIIEYIYFGISLSSVISKVVTLSSFSDYNIKYWRYKSVGKFRAYKDGMGYKDYFYVGIEFEDVDELNRFIMEQL